MSPSVAFRGSVFKYLRDLSKDQGGGVFPLVDPLDLYLEAKEKGHRRGAIFEYVEKRAAELATTFCNVGADAILIGGSIGAFGEPLDRTTKSIRNLDLDIPVITFPGLPGAVTRYAHAIWRLSLINSLNPYFISGAQAQSAPILDEYHKEFELQVIPVAYILVGKGEAAGLMSDIKEIPCDRPDLISNYAVTGAQGGNKIILIDMGSGSAKPVPLPAIKESRSKVPKTILIGSGGGIKEPSQAHDQILHGADFIQIGTKIGEAESIEDAGKIVDKFIREARRAGKEKLKKRN